MFVVYGPLPQSVADEMLLLNPAVPTKKSPSRPAAAAATTSGGNRLGTRDDAQEEEEDAELKRALAMSLDEDLQFETDRDLQLALALSRRDRGAVPSNPASSEDHHAPSTQNREARVVEEPAGSGQPGAAAAAPPSAEELRRLRASFLDKFQTNAATTSNPSPSEDASVSGEKPEKSSS